MFTSLTSQAEPATAPAERGVMVKWGPLTLLTVATFYSTSSGFCIPAISQHARVNSSALQPLFLFAVGIAPVFGAALMVWTSRHGVSPQERRSQLVGAAMSAFLFLPAVLLVRFFN